MEGKTLPLPGPILITPHPNPSTEISFARRTFKNVVSGTISGIAGCIVGHPFDTLKVRLQTQPTHAPIYNGLIDCFIKTLKWEGIGGLYKGVGSPIVGQMFFRATLFTSYYQMQSLLAEKEGQRLSKTGYFIAGGLTGSIAAFVECPIDLLKTKMQIQIMKQRAGEVVPYRNVFHACYVIISQHGVKALFQGLFPTILRDTPGCAAYFGFYELMKTQLTSTPQQLNNPSSWVIFLSASTGGVLYWVITYPIDVLKSTMQSDESQVDKRKFKNIADAARRLYVEEGGWRRFFKGFSPCLLRAIPANVTMLWTVEKVRILLGPYF